MKKIFLIVLAFISLLQAEEFDWYKIKSEIENKNLNQNKSKKIKTIIQKKYGVTVEKEKLSDIKKKLKEKNTLFGVNFKSSAKLPNGNQTSNFGIFMQSILDFSSIGYFTTPDMYVNIIIYTEKIQMNLIKRVFNANGLEFFYGAGSEFIQDGYGPNRINFHFDVDFSYSYKGYGVETHFIIPLNYSQYVSYYGNSPSKAGIISINLFKRF